MGNHKLDWPTRVSRHVLTALKPRKLLEDQNIWNLYGDIAWFGVLFGVVNTFLAVYTLRLGGTDTQVGLLSALPALVAIFVSLPGARLVEKERRPLSVLFITAILHRAGYVAIALLPFFFFIEQAWGVVLLSGLLTIPQAIANIAFTTMFARVVKPEKRAQVVAVRNVLIGITSTATALVGGKFLDWIVFPLNYQILFTVAFATSMVSAYYLTRIRLPELTEPAPLRAPNERMDVRGFFRMLHASPGYTRFTLVSFVAQWALWFSIPLYSIYWVRTLHASDGWVGLFSMVASGTTILFYPLWGRVTARRGNRIAMIVTMAGLAGFPFLLAFSPSVEWVLLVSFLGGVFSSGQALSFFNGLLEVCPEQNRAARIAAYSTLAGLAAFAAPLLSTSLTDVFSIQAMLIVGAALRLFSSFLIWQQRVLVTPKPYYSPNDAFFGKMESMKSE
ncbi:MAG: MFS transporter [Chloroflexi bacterium]|nr:MFS transporter [Chloroflexota bacterium]